VSTPVVAAGSASNLGTGLGILAVTGL